MDVISRAELTDIPGVGPGRAAILLTWAEDVVDSRDRAVLDERRRVRDDQRREADRRFRALKSHQRFHRYLLVLGLIATAIRGGVLNSRASQPQEGLFVGFIVMIYVGLLLVLWFVRYGATSGAAGSYWTDRILSTCYLLLLLPWWLIEV